MTAKTAKIAVFSIEWQGNRLYNSKINFETYLMAVIIAGQSYGHIDRELYREWTEASVTE